MTTMTVKARHTPGPWSVYEPTNVVCGPEFQGQIVAECCINRTGHRANARLIAAAPELLEALEYAISQVPELATVPGIAAAIAKATGNV